MKRSLARAVLLAFCLQPHAPVARDYYEPFPYGSDSLYSPFSNFLSYSFDSLQLPDSFDSRDFSDNLDTVLDNLSHPRRAIDAEGGMRRFINRQVIPIDSQYSNESYAALPNYALHMLGGGIVYRKDLEWFRKSGAAFPTASAVSLAMIAELLQETLEKKTTTQDDEVADFYLFRPAGILLFHNERFAAAFMRVMDPAVWPYLQVFDVSRDRLFNTGINYVYRPPGLEFMSTRPFLFTGLNNLLGLSHRAGGKDWLSWGLGYATQQVDLSLSQQVELEPSLGLFYDRDKSLLWSLVINDTGGKRFRFNLYPTGRTGAGRLGYFIGGEDVGGWSFGFVYAIQLGIGFTFE